MGEGEETGARQERNQASGRQRPRVRYNWSRCEPAQPVCRRKSMRASRWMMTGCAGCAILLAACMTAAPNVRTPLGAHLTPDAKTGPQVALRFDPTAKVILSNAS